MNGPVGNTSLHHRIAAARAATVQAEERGIIALGMRQSEFAAALVDPERDVPAGVVGPDGEPSTRRFNVYRNNIVTSLTRTLRDAYPATTLLVGEEFFAAMARTYIAAEAPRSPMLFDYGEGFPQFIRRFEPVAALAYLADVARIERAWVEAYHAPERCPISPSVVARVCPDHLSSLRVVLHPSLRVVRSPFPAFTIWRMNVDKGAPQGVGRDAANEDVLIIRPHAEVEAHLLAPGSAAFIEELSNGLTMLEATRAAICDDIGFDLALALSQLMRTGAFVELDVATQALQPTVQGES